MSNIDSVHTEAINTLKKEVEKLSDKIETLCPKWVIVIIVSLCGCAFGTLFLLQISTSKDIAKLTTSAMRTQSDISRMLQIIDAGNFVKRDELENEIKKIVHNELYFWEREQRNKK